MRTKPEAPIDPAMDDAIQALAQRIRQAGESGTRLRVRGHGSKLPATAAAGVQDLSSGLLGQATWHEPTELVITASAAAPIAHVEAILAAQGQCLPFEPPRFGGAGTIGGMVASGLSGPARMNVGPLRDFVLGVEMINGRGEFLRFGGQVMKNVAGYDLSRLMAGSWGSLGVLTTVSLKVLPTAPAEVTLVWERTQQQALSTFARWRAQPLPIDASAWMAEDGRGLLYLRLRGAQAAVAAACRLLGGDPLEHLAARAFWDAVRDQTHPLLRRDAQRTLWRLSVPATAPVLNLPTSPLVEWHGGLRWTRCATAREAQQVQESARAAGGHARAFQLDSLRGVDSPPRVSAPEQRTPEAGIAARLFLAFDPRHAFDRCAMAAAG